MEEVAIAEQELSQVEMMREGGYYTSELLAIIRHMPTCSGYSNIVTSFSPGEGANCRRQAEYLEMGTLAITLLIVQL